jgi:hypothetical protein
MARKSRRSFVHKITPDLSDPALRSRLAWRTGLVLITAAVAWGAAVSAVVGINRLERPQTATRFSAHDPRALTELAAYKIAAGDSKTADRLLRRAIAQQAFLPKAFGLMAAVAYQEDQDARAVRLMDMSRKLSRRDAVTSSLYIQRATDKGDVASLLKNYDIALRTNVDLNQQLAPKLAAALDVAEFKPYFRDIVRNQPPWLGQVVMIALHNTKNPSQLADLLMTAGRLPDAAIQKTAESTLLSKIAEVGDWSMLRRYYLSLPNASPALLTDPGFSAKSIDPAHAPISWMLASEVAVEAGFFDGPAKPKLNGVAYSGSRGAFANKRLLLSPAAYTLSIKSSGFDPDGSAQAWASVFCYTAEGRQLLVSLPLVNGVRSAQLTINNACAAQSIELGLAGGDSQDGAEINIESLSLSRN